MITAEDILSAQILIVDDKQANVRLLERGLRTAGYVNISSTRDPNAVWDLHRKNNYDLILLDLEMPGMDGFEVLEGIKAIEMDKSLPILVVTADPSQKLRALKEGVKDFVSKPFEMVELYARAKNMIEMRLMYTEAKAYTRKLEGMLKEMQASQNLNQVLNRALHKRADASDTENVELESYSHSVSHDLRSPLRFVNQIAHMLLENPDEPLPEKATQQVNIIVQATDEMGQLIERLLTFSQASREPMKVRKVDLQKLFQKIAKEKKNGHEVEIVIEEMEPCQGDQTLLKEVVANLLENAIKFTQRREGAKITVGCIEKDGEHVYFVKDNGAGFDMKDSDSLFVPFQRLHKGSDFKGTGIGLALVQRIIERHGGRIWAEGEVNKGATFYFTIGKEVTE